MADQKEFKVQRPGMDHSSRFNKKKEKLNDPWGTTRRLLGYLGGRKWSLILIFLFAFLVTGISIVGTRIIGYAVDHCIQKNDLASLAFVCIMLATIYLASTVVTFFQNRMMVDIAQISASNIRKDLFASLQKLPLNYFDTHSSGDLMSRLTNDVDNISTTISQNITQFFSGIINIVGMLAAMLLLSPTLTSVTLFTTPLMLMMTRFIIKRTQPYFVKQQKELGNLNGFIEEMISAQKTVLLFSEEDRVNKQFSEVNGRLTGSAIRALSFSGVMGPVNNFVNNLSYLIVAVLGGYLALSGRSGITVGSILTFVIYMRGFTRPINELLNMFNTIQSALAGGERVFEVIDEQHETDLPDAHDIDTLEGHVCFENVDFSYTKGKKILENLNLEADKNSIIAVVGPTGSGKTTIISLLTKFYDIDCGRIMMDGKDISKIRRESLRRNISMVLQDTFLFSETVMENIRYGNINAGDDEVFEAAKLANAHHFIMQLPQGYNTILSDNGSDLSHGQRQLLAIARAVLAKASILILDEATSSIDTRTELAIQSAMLKLMQGKTTFVIAHRLSTIRNADKIIALRDGKIVETGTHHELISKDGFYAHLYNSQFNTGIA